MAYIRDEHQLVYVVEDDDIANICRLLEARVGPTKIYIQCSDNISRTFTSLNEFLEFENSPSKAIEYLSIDATAIDHPRSSEGIGSADVNLFSMGSIDIEISGAEREGIPLRDEIREIVFGMKPWYELIARGLASTFRTMSTSIAWIMFLVYMYFEMRPPAEERAESVDPTFYEVVAVMVILNLVIWIPIIAVEKLAGIVHHKLFPEVSFALGQGRKRHQNAQIWRLITVSLVSAAILTIVVSTIQFFIG